MPEFYIGVLMIFSAIALTSQSEKLKQHKLDEKQQQRKHLCANNTYKNVRSPPQDPKHERKSEGSQIFIWPRGTSTNSTPEIMTGERAERRSAF